MALENILRLAGLENEGRGLVEAVEKDPYVNVPALINEAEKKNGSPDLFDKTGYAPEDFEEMHPARAKRTAAEWYSENRVRLAEESVKSYEAIVNALKKDKKGAMKLAHAVLAVSPELYRGKKSKMSDSHKKMYEAVKYISENPEQAIEILAKGLEKNTVNNVALILVKSNPSMMVDVLNKYVERINGEYFGAFNNANDAVRYLNDVYQNAGSDERKQIAYNVASSLVQETEGKLPQLQAVNGQKRKRRIVRYNSEDFSGLAA